MFVDRARCTHVAKTIIKRTYYILETSLIKNTTRSILSSCQFVHTFTFTTTIKTCLCTFYLFLRDMEKGITVAVCKIVVERVCV